MANRQGSQGRIPDSRMPEHELYQRVQVTVPPELYRRLDAFCTDEERARSWVCCKALEEWLEEKGY